MAHILVVDDDVSQREAIRRILVQAGHEVTLAGDGLEGLNLVTSKPFALAFVDLYMPRMDGLEAIPRLLLQVPGLKIVAMSGGVLGGKGTDLLRVAEGLGAERVLQKPFGVIELQDVVAELIESSEEA